MIQISSLVTSLAPSATLAMSQKSQELRAAGVDVINMSVGEPDFNTPEYIKEGAIQAINDNFSHYSPVPGFLSLREAICKKMLADKNVAYTPDQIVVGNGAKQELANAILATINPGDEVIIPVPAWVSYMEMVKMAQGKAITVKADISQDFKITPEQLEKAITPRTKMLMLNSPSNPTGSIYSRQELTGIKDVLVKYPDIMVLADDIYEHINFVDEVVSLCEFPEIRDRVIVVNGVSKAYAMTGWRIGWMAAPKVIAKAVTKLQGQYTSGACAIAQKAAETALTGPQTECAEMCKAFRRRRDLIVSLAHEIPGWKVNVPQGAFYLFPDVSSYIGKSDGKTVIRSSGDYTMYVLEKANVACVDGAAFSLPGYMRLSYATSDDNIREAMRRIRDASFFLR